MPGGWYDRALLTKLDVMPRPMPPEQPSYQVHRRSTRHRRVVCERPAQTSLQSELERHDQMHRALLAARARAGGIGPNVLHALSPRRSPRRLDPLASLLDSRRSPSHSRGGDAVRANDASHTREHGVRTVPGDGCRGPPEYLWLWKEHLQLPAANCKLLCDVDEAAVSSHRSSVGAHDAEGSPQQPSLSLSSPAKRRSDEGEGSDEGILVEGRQSVTTRHRPSTTATLGGLLRGTAPEQVRGAAS